MTEGDLVACLFYRLGEEGDIAVESDSITSSDDVDVLSHVCLSLL